MAEHPHSRFYLNLGTIGLIVPLPASTPNLGMLCPFIIGTLFLAKTQAYLQMLKLTIKKQIE